MSTSIKTEEFLKLAQSDVTKDDVKKTSKVNFQIII